MRGVFADAGYWIALVNPADKLHPKARAVSNSLGGARIVTSEMVLIEVLNKFSGMGKALRQLAVDLVEDLRSDSDVFIVPQSSLQFQEALSLYADRSDKAWGLTDCSSIRIMIRDGLTQALSHDHHFQQAGFRALLRDSV